MGKMKNFIYFSSPIMSPDWSPDEKVALCFENGLAEIFIQDLKSEKEIQFKHLG